MATVTAMATETEATTIKTRSMFDIFSCRRSLAQDGMFQGATDRHSHILPGVDDGVKTIEDTLQILQYGELLGVRNWWCTPHVMEDCPNTTEDLKARFDALCEAYGGPIRLHLAAEYMLDTVFDQRLKDRDLLTMEDDMLLVEASVMAEPYDLPGKLREIMSAGYRPLLAHPERYRYLGEKDFEKLHEMGVLFQLNLASVTGYYGDTAKRKAEFILKKGWYMTAGSDCHRREALLKQYSSRTVKKSICRKVAELLK